jgi:hypothetical protein
MHTLIIQICCIVYVHFVSSLNIKALGWNLYMLRAITTSIFSKTARGVKNVSVWEGNVRDIVAGASNISEGNVKRHGWSGCGCGCIRP